MDSTGILHLQVAGLRLSVHGLHELGKLEDFRREFASFEADPVPRPDVVIGWGGTALIASAPRPASTDVLCIGLRAERRSGQVSSAHRVRCRVIREESLIAVDADLPDLMALVAGINVALSLLLPRRGGLLMHAAAVAVGGRAIVFPGISGTGKSTASAAVPGGIRLAEDRCVLARDGDSWVVQSIPTGPAIYEPQQAVAMPLAGLVFIEKDRPLGTAAPTLLDSVLRLLPAVLRPPDLAAPERQILDLVVDLARRVRCVRLSYTVGDDFWPALAEPLGICAGGAIG